MNTVLYAGWLLLPAVPSLGLLVFFLIARTEPTRRAVLALLMVSLFLGAAWVIVAGWFLRDGLGPGATDSQGPAAVGRFLRDAWLPLLVLAMIAAAALVTDWMRRKAPSERS